MKTHEEEMDTPQPRTLTCALLQCWAYIQCHKSYILLSHLHAVLECVHWISNNADIHSLKCKSDYWASTYIPRMTHICIKDSSAHFNRPFGGYRQTMPLSFLGTPCSHLSTFWLLYNLSWSFSQREMKRQILCTAVNILHRQHKIAKAMASCLEACRRGRRAITSSMIVSHHSRQTMFCDIQQLTACGYVRTNRLFSFGQKQV